ncbi:hypothetical protein [Microbacterium lacticum]|uniref:Uncharacterized protein n=1 Tax=Microbacterium lacticum TaxID=33885 RepID=A0A4Y3UGU6_9MICO|nr:hypothetical protein [Microbacterium lacticum]TQN00757.1 hypothetical protein FHX68_0876 [Microbacterium lacticum]GEB94161.1 hypothetical protein MLA01_03800 [Microbacterium lacticum]GGN13804.1 hypothetical protein GCM10009724_03950 [Microbacterium lacticum]
MTINTKLYVEAYAAYQAELAAAATWTHRDYSNSGITRERARRVVEARKKFQAKIPAALRPETLTDHRPKVLDALAPKSADAVAVHSHEWATVEAALKSGRVIQQVIMEATSVERLAAILSHAEAFAYGQETSDPAGVAADLKSMVYDRLVQVDYEPAVTANTSNEQFAAHQAWHEVMTEALGTDQSLGSLTALHSADPEGYRALAVARATADPTGDVRQAVARIDSLVVSGDLKVG